MRGSEASGGAQLEAPRAELLTQPTANPSNSVMTSVWNGTYQMINRANLVLDKAPDITDNPRFKDRLVGETKFLRAWAYFELVSMWGDVPYIHRTITSATGYKANRPPPMCTHNYSGSDCCSGQLPASYGASDLGRATSGAANALARKG